MHAPGRHWRPAGAAMSRVQPGLRHIANSLPLCQGEQLVIGGGVWTETKNHHHQPPHTQKQNTQIPAPFHCHKTRESFPQDASTAESYRAVERIMSVFISLFLSFLWVLAYYWRLVFAGACVRVCVCMYAGVFVHYAEDSTHQAQNHWGLSGAVNTLWDMIVQHKHSSTTGH